MTNNIKRKKYLVPVRSHVSAEMVVFANSKLEAWEIAEKDMAESLRKQLSTAQPHTFIQSLDGYSEALRTGIKIIKN